MTDLSPVIQDSVLFHKIKNRGIIKRYKNGKSWYIDIARMELIEVSKNENDNHFTRVQ